MLVNGESSEPFFVSRGVRQGCPLPPLLYVIMAKTIASTIRNSPVIDGFSFPGHSCAKLYQYADNTSVFVMSDAALLEVFSLFRRYKLASGAKLNVTKSHGLLVGSWATRTHRPIQLNWSSQHITIMGAQVSNMESDESWIPPLQKLDAVLSQWLTRRLSYHGRASVGLWTESFFGTWRLSLYCRAISSRPSIRGFFLLCGSSDASVWRAPLSRNVLTEVALMWSIFTTKFLRYMLCGCVGWLKMWITHPLSSFAIHYVLRSRDVPWNRYFLLLRLKPRSICCLLFIDRLWFRGLRFHDGWNTASSTLANPTYLHTQFYRCLFVFCMINFHEWTVLNTDVSPDIVRGVWTSNGRWFGRTSIYGASSDPSEILIG